MRRTWILVMTAVTIAALSFTGPALAGHGGDYTIEEPWTVDGIIPTTVPFERVDDPCNPGSGPASGNGVVGEVYELPTSWMDGVGEDDHHFEFEVGETAGANVVWYDDSEGNCDEVAVRPDSQTTMCCHTLTTRATTLTVSQSGPIPQEATHVVVDYGGGGSASCGLCFGSAAGSYQLTLPVEAGGSCDASPFC